MSLPELDHITVKVLQADTVAPLWEREREFSSEESKLWASLPRILREQKATKVNPCIAQAPLPRGQVPHLPTFPELYLLERDTHPVDVGILGFLGGKHTKNVSPRAEGRTKSVPVGASPKEERRSGKAAATEQC